MFKVSLPVVIMSLFLLLLFCSFAMFYLHHHLPVVVPALLLRFLPTRILVGVVLLGLMSFVFLKQYCHFLLLMFLLALFAQLVCSAFVS